MVKCELCGANANIFSEYKGINRDNALMVKAFADKTVWRCPDCHYCFCYPMVDFKLLKQYYESCYWDEERKLTTKFLTNFIKFVPGVIARRILARRPLAVHIQSMVDLVIPYIDEKGGAGWLAGNGTLEIGAGAAEISRVLRRHYQSGKPALAFHVVEPGD